MARRSRLKGYFMRMLKRTVASESGISPTSAVAASAAVVLVLVATCLVVRSQGRQPLKFDTPYQAVLLTNGAVYFGKLENYGTRFPVLSDVYYVQSSVNPETKQTSNILIKRGKELHAPDRMYLNPNQITLVEPVGPNSKVAQLIAESKSKGQ
jgi:hypothetical protein